jgi:hypothetical protein
MSNNVGRVLIQSDGISLTTKVVDRETDTDITALVRSIEWRVGHAGQDRVATATVELIAPALMVEGQAVFTCPCCREKAQDTGRATALAALSEYVGEEEAARYLKTRAGRAAFGDSQDTGSHTCDRDDAGETR